MSWTAGERSTVEWATPDWLFRELEMEFGPFDLDPASTHENAKTARHYTAEDDGLALPWAGRVLDRKSVV